MGCRPNYLSPSFAAVPIIVNGRSVSDAIRLPLPKLSPVKRLLAHQGKILARLANRSEFRKSAGEKMNNLLSPRAVYLWSVSLPSERMDGV